MAIIVVGKEPVESDIPDKNNNKELNNPEPFYSLEVQNITVDEELPLEDFGDVFSEEQSIGFLSGVGYNEGAVEASIFFLSDLWELPEWAANALSGSGGVDPDFADETRQPEAGSSGDAR